MRIQFKIYTFLSFFSTLSTIIQISIQCTQNWVFTSDSISISDSITRYLFTMTSFRFTTFYSLSLAVSSRHLVIKFGRLVGLHIVPSILNREVSNNHALTDLPLMPPQQSGLSGWLTLSTITLRTVTAHWAWVCLSSLVPDHQAQTASCKYFQSVWPFLSEKTISLSTASPLILLSLTERLV